MAQQHNRRRRRGGRNSQQHAGGWRPPERMRATTRLVFDDPDLRGLVVRVRRPTPGALRAAAGLGTVDAERLGAGTYSEADIAKIDAALVELGKAIVSWNLVDDHGRPVPYSPAALAEQDLVLVLDIYAAWMEMINRTRGHTDGNQPPAEPVDESAIPQEPLG